MAVRGALIAALVVVAATPVRCLAQDAPSAPPPTATTGFSAAGGAVLAPLHRAPEPCVAIPLAEWSSLFKHSGFGDVVGMVSSDHLALGVGHRFPDLDAGEPGGGLVSFTVGPAYMVRWRACDPGEGGCRDGLAGGEWAVFASVRFKRGV